MRLQNDNRNHRISACALTLLLASAGCAMETGAPATGEGALDVREGEPGVPGDGNGAAAGIGGDDAIGAGDGAASTAESSKTMEQSQEACLADVIDWCLDEYEHECAEADDADACAEELTAFCGREFAHECESAGDGPDEGDETGGEGDDGDGADGQADSPEACLEEIVVWCLDDNGAKCAEADDRESCIDELEAFCKREFAHECEPTEEPKEDLPGEQQTPEECVAGVVASCLDKNEAECAEADDRERCIDELEAFCKREFAGECEPAAEEKAEEEKPAEGGGADKEACVREVIEACLSEYGGECEGADKPEACLEQLEVECKSTAAAECA